MFEKNLRIGYLLDFYGDVLSGRKRQVMDLYYNDDLSLGEIAAEIGISRQGVRDLIKKAEEELTFYEENLGMAERFGRIREQANTLAARLEAAGVDEDICHLAQELVKTAGT